MFVWVPLRNTYSFPYSYAHTEPTCIGIYVCMYHDVHVLILSDMYIHVHTCVHVHTYVVFVRTYVGRYIYVCTHMCTLTHIRQPSIPLNKKIGLTSREKRQEHPTKSHANKSKCFNKNMKTCVSTYLVSHTTHFSPPRKILLQTVGPVCLSRDLNQTGVFLVNSRSFRNINFLNGVVCVASVWYHNPADQWHVIEWAKWQLYQ